MLNDPNGEAAESRVRLAGVRVRAGGDFEDDSWTSHGITYAVDIDSKASAELIRNVDAAAEIPRAIRAGAKVERQS